MLTKNDLSLIRKIVKEESVAAVAPLDTKITKLDVKISGQIADLKAKTTKDAERLEAAIRYEHKVGATDFGYLENEDRKIKIKVDRIEKHLGFATA